jgi:hypothetical protein
MFKRFAKDSNEFRKIFEVLTYSGLCIVGFGLYHRYNMNKISELENQIKNLKKYKDSL